MTSPAPAAHAYETIRKVLTALAFASLLLFGFLLFAGVRANGANCGSPASPKLVDLHSLGSVTACREALDTREMWTWVSFGVCVILLVVAVIVGKAGQAANRTTVAAPTPHQIGAGWYPDQQDPSQLRWFDGYQWTAATLPRP